MRPSSIAQIANILSRKAENTYTSGAVEDPRSPVGQLGGQLGGLSVAPINVGLYPQNHVGGNSQTRSQSTSSSGSGGITPTSGNPVVGPMAPGDATPLSPAGVLPPNSGIGIPSTSALGLGLQHAGQPLLHPYHGSLMGRIPGGPTHIPQMGRRFACKLCAAVSFPTMFDSKAELQIHTQVHMREAKPYKCTHCTKSFANSSYLSQHMRIHLGIKPFGPCQYCGRKFTQLSHLQQHLRTHTGEKPYKCRFCDKAFSQLSNLNSHSRCHMTDKPFKCNSCHKCFNQEQELMDHIPKHKESKHLKIHICPYCGKSYTQATYLAKHMTKHADRRDRDVRLRDMMRPDERDMWTARDNVCVMHGIIDSCCDTAPSTPLHYSFPAPNMMSTQPCTYTPPGISSNMAAGMSPADPSAFTRLGALSAAALGRSFGTTPAGARNPYSFAYDNFKTSAHTSGLGHPSAPSFHSQLIRLDDIRQYAGQAASSTADISMFGGVNKREY